MDCSCLYFRVPGGWEGILFFAVLLFIFSQGFFIAVCIVFPAASCCAALLFPSFIPLLHRAATPLIAVKKLCCCF